MLTIVFWVEDRNGKRIGREYKTFRGALRHLRRLGEFDHFIRRELRHA